MRGTLDCDRSAHPGFHESVQLHKGWQFPQPTYESNCAGEILQCYAVCRHRRLGTQKKAKVGHNIVHNVSRAAAAHLSLPVDLKVNAKLNQNLTLTLMVN